MKNQIVQDYLRRIAAVEARNGDPIFTSSRAYAAKVDAYPEIDADVEQELARIGGDDARRILFTCTLRHAAKVAFAMTKLGQDRADMIGAANLGLWEAALRFRPGRGAGFKTYASHWIRAELFLLIAQSTSAASMTGERAARATVLRLQSVKKEMGFTDSRLSKAEAEAVALRLGVEAADVLAMDMAQRPETADADEKLAAADDGAGGEAELLEQLDARRRLESVNAILEELSERDRSIFIGRRLAAKQASLEELGGRFGLSRQRVQQIEVAVLRRLRAA